MEFKGTKGPWYYGGGNTRAIFHPTDIGVRLCVVDNTFDGIGWSTRSSDEWIHNAHLIASAPLLLEALQLALTELEQYIPITDVTVTDKVKQAINAALGTNEK